jgi:hypothetical protein
MPISLNDANVILVFLNVRYLTRLNCLKNANTNFALGCHFASTVPVYGEITEGR